MIMDIFLFDVGKAETLDGINFELLEKIMNGKSRGAKTLVAW